MTDDYWMDENLGSTISFTKTEKDGTVSKFHLSVFKDDTVNAANTESVRRNYTITQDVSDNISSSILVTPIVTYDAENAFAFDTQATEQVNLSFIRKNPIGTIHIKETEQSQTLTEHQLPWDESLDDRHWSNRKWMTEFSRLINRWQVDTDGCVMSYEPLDDTLQYAYSVNVYLRNLSFSLNVESNEVVRGNLDVQIGSMTADAARAEDSDVLAEGYNDRVMSDSMTVSMTSSDGLATYLLYCKGLTVGGVTKDLNCISDYTLKGGPEQPFEYLTMNISKKRLSVVAPNLLDDIIAGRNKVIIDAMGKGQFIVTKCSTSSTNYKIVAYSICEIYRSVTNQAPIYFGMDVGSTPFGVIQSILNTDNKAGVGANMTPVYFTQNTIKFAYFTKNNTWAKDYSCYFNNNTSVWYILSVCAMKLNCKIWFSDNYAYVVDTSITEDMLARAQSAGITTNMGGLKQHISKLYLNTSDPFPISATDTELEFVKSVCGTVSLGNEGAETICNSVKIQFDANKDSRYTLVGDEKDYTELKRGGYVAGVTATGVEHMLMSGLSDRYKYAQDVTPYSLIARSQAMYGIKEIVYKIPELGLGDANDIAVKVANSYCDGEQSIGFNLKETHKILVTDDNIMTWQKYYPDIEAGEYVYYWQRYFPAFAQVDNIYDYSNDLIVSNTSNFSCPSKSEYNPNNVTYDDDHTFYVPKNSSFRITADTTPIILSLEGPAYYTGETIPEGYYSTLKVFDLDDNDITDSTSITIIDTETRGSMTYATIDIKIERDCYVYIYRSPLIIGSVTRGGKVIFRVKGEYQELPHKLCLSTFEHHFPEGTTEYWFGIMKPTDITQNTSEISNAIYNH